MGEWKNVGGKFRDKGLPAPRVHALENLLQASFLHDQPPRPALPMAGKRDGWIEQRLGYLASAGEQARLKAGVPLRRFLRGAMIAYRRFLLDSRPRPPLSVLGDDSRR
jgi:hypothetical protein